MSAPMGRAELLRLAQQSTVSVETAGRACGVSRGAAYAAVKAGEFPAPVVRCGRRLVVPTAPLMALLGVTPHVADSATTTTPTGQPPVPAQFAPRPARNTACQFHA